jgi:hypothetical protein
MNPNCNPQDHNNKVALIIKELEQKGMTQHIEKETRRFSENYNRYCEQQQQHQLHHQQQPNNHTIIPTTTTTTIRPIYKGPYPYKTDYQYIQAIYSGEAKTNPLTGELEIIKTKHENTTIKEIETTTTKEIIKYNKYFIFIRYLPILLLFILVLFNSIYLYSGEKKESKDALTIASLSMLFLFITIIIFVLYFKNNDNNIDTIIFIKLSIGVFVFCTSVLSIVASSYIIEREKNDDIKKLSWFNIVFVVIYLIIESFIFFYTNWEFFKT